MLDHMTFFHRCLQVPDADVIVAVGAEHVAAILRDGRVNNVRAEHVETPTKRIVSMVTTVSVLLLSLSLSLSWLLSM